MILELGNGRELRLPDSMDDDTAKTLGQWILMLEKRADDAEYRAKAIEDEYRSKAMDKPLVVTESEAAKEIAELRKEMAAMMSQLVALASADRMIVYDAAGSPRSRIVRG